MIQGNVSKVAVKDMQWEKIFRVDHDHGGVVGGVGRLWWCGGCCGKVMVMRRRAGKVQ